MPAIEIPGLGRLTVDRVLIENDGPRVFTCASESGARYLAVSVDESATSETWLYIPADESLVGDLDRGLPLRDAILSAPGGTAHVVEWPFDSPQPTLATSHQIASLPETWLPGASAGLPLLDGL